MIHVIDLNASDAEQWIHLMHTLKEYWRVSSSNSRLLPFLKVTGIHEKKEVLEKIGFELMGEAEKLGFPFFFYPVVSKLEDVVFEKLPSVKENEAIAIVSVLQLHSLLAADDQPVSTTGGVNNSPAGTHSIFHMHGAWLNIYQRMRIQKLILQ